MVKRKPVPPDAAEAEELAHRAGIEAYVNKMQELLGRKDFFDTLADTSHVHKSLAKMTDGRALMVTVRVQFGRSLDASELQELIQHAKTHPGGVPEA